jgi:hypothetical protein
MLLVLMTGAACDGEAGRRDVATDSVPADSTPSADSAAVEPAFADRSVLAVCDTLTNSFDCARSIEDRLLPDTDRAARHGDTLALVLAAGDTLRLVDESGDHSDVVYYSYQGHWPPAGQFLVQRQYYEGAEHVMVDDSTGDQTVIPDRPLLSPDSRRFAVLSLDLVAGYGPNTLQLWRLEDGVPTMEWETSPSQWGPTDGAWESDTALHFTQHGYCSELGGKGRDMCDRAARLYRSGGTWHLETGSAGGDG